MFYFSLMFNKCWYGYCIFIFLPKQYHCKVTDLPICHCLCEKRFYSACILLLHWDALPCRMASTTRLCLQIHNTQIESSNVHCFKEEDLSRNALNKNRTNFALLKCWILFPQDHMDASKYIQDLLKQLEESHRNIRRQVP